MSATLLEESEIYAPVEPSRAMSDNHDRSAAAAQAAAAREIRKYLFAPLIESLAFVAILAMLGTATYFAGSHFIKPAKAFNSSQPAADPQAGVLEVDERFFVAFAGHLKLEAMRSAGAATTNWKSFVLSAKNDFADELDQAARRWVIELNPDAHVWVRDDWRIEPANAVLMIAKVSDAAFAAPQYIVIDTAALVRRGSVADLTGPLAEWEGRGVRLPSGQVIGSADSPY